MGNYRFLRKGNKKDLSKEIEKYLYLGKVKGEEVKVIYLEIVDI